MPIRRKPGDVMEVDWAGATLTVMDNAAGEEIEAYVFVAALPYSQYFYAEAFLDMRSRSVLDLNRRGLLSSSYQSQMYTLYEALSRYIDPSHLTIVYSAGAAKEKHLTVERNGKVITVNNNYKTEHYDINQCLNGFILLYVHEDVVKYLT